MNLKLLKNNQFHNDFRTKMSRFQVRDARASAEFSDRIAVVFGGISDGRVKASEQSLREIDDKKTDFDEAQMHRSGHSKEKIVKLKSINRTNDKPFKKPPILSHKRNKINKTPGFKKNPSGYTKYSLADVPEISNKSNTAAALDFLNQLKY